MAAAEKRTLRLEGPLAVVTRELGVGSWDEETQSITVEVDRVDETRARLAEIAGGA